jgi:hypothetical protein
VAERHREEEAAEACDRGGRGAPAGGEAEDVEAGVTGEALGRGGKGAPWWRGGVRRRRKRPSLAWRHEAEEVGT